MSTVAVDIRQCFGPIIGKRPWRARIGVGSFLTLDFGPKISVDGHQRGSWHLWIYMSSWVLVHGDLKLVDSDSRRPAISAAVRRLEAETFDGIEVDTKTHTTVFTFGDFRLTVTPADYVDNPNDASESWLFFMPDNLVLSSGPGGVEVRPSNE